MCIVFLKKAKAIWNNRTNEISLLNRLQNFLKEFNPDYFVLKTKAKEIENGSADHVTNEINYLLNGFRN